MNARLLGDISGNNLLMLNRYCCVLKTSPIVTNFENRIISTTSNRAGRNFGGVARRTGWAGDVASDAARLNWTNWKNEEADQADSLPGSVD